MSCKLFYLIIVGVLVFTFDGLGQNTWVKTFGGSSKDFGHSITTTNDGGYVLTGETSSIDGDFGGMNKGYEDIIVIKLNSNGDIVWKKTYGGSSYDEGRSITTTNDGGYVLTGETRSNDGDFSGMNKGSDDIFVIKLNSNGETVWKKTYGGSSRDEGRSITTTNDGGYVLTGETRSNDGDFSGMNKGSDDIFVIKLNSSGETVWKKTYGGSSYDEGRSITTTNDGGYVLTGYTTMYNGSDDIFVIKLNSNGETVWKKTYGGSSRDEGRSITTTTDGGYVLTGYTWSNDGDFSGMNKGNGDIFVIKLNSNGDTVWKKTFGGSSYDEGRSITTTNDGGYVLTGYTTMYNGYYDIFVIKLNSNGETVWKKTYGGSSRDEGRSITTTKDGGYVLTGGTYSNDGDFSEMNKGGDDIFVMKLDTNGNLNTTTTINEFSEPTTTLSVYPNPFSNSTTVSYKVDTPSNVRIELLNTLGQTIEVLREDYTDIGTYQLPLNVSTLSSGMYSIRMRSGSMNELIPVWVVR